MFRKIMMLSVVCAGLFLRPVSVPAQSPTQFSDQSSGQSPDQLLAEPLDQPDSSLAEESVEADEPVGMESLFDPDQGSGELRAIKEKIQSSVRENEELTPRARALKQELLDLQKKVEDSRATVAALQQEHAREIKDMRDSGQPQSLRQLRLYSLQCQKRELELGLKLKELALRDKQQAFDLQSEGSRKELEEDAAEEKRLSSEAGGLKEQNFALTRELESLKQENILLENQLKLPVTPQSSAGTKPGSGTVWKNIRGKEEEKARLERRVEQLWEEQARSSPDPSLSEFEARFRDSARRLEEENRQLKNQIFSLQEEIQKRPSR